MFEKVPSWEVLAEEQAGVVARHQLLHLGMTPAQARQRVETKRWRAILTGVYATHTGPLSDLAKVWAAVLYAGAQAHASHRTALWLCGVNDRLPDVVEVAIPANRRILAPVGIRVHLSRRLAERCHPAARPARTRVEEAALDVADELDVEEMLALIFRVTQRRISTAARLRSALARRARHRWRPLLLELLSELDGGVASALERRYAQDVERAHGLPPGQRNRPEPRLYGAPGTWYRDVRYRQWHLIIELDGRAAHPTA